MARVSSFLLICIGLIFITVSLSTGEIQVQPASPTITSSPNPVFASSETIYFWRISGGDSGIYYARPNQPPQPLSSLNQSGCVGCHVVSNRAGRIAAVMDTATGPVVAYDLRTGQEILLPSANASYLSWSPNGDQLAISYGDKDIYIIDLEKQTLTPLSGASAPGMIETMPAWSPDGKEIIFVRSSTAPDGFELDGDSELVVAPAIGGASEVLSGVPTGRNYYPAYSPDGRWLAFTHHSANEGCYGSEFADIYLLPLAGGTAIRMNANSDSSDSWPSWSADGQWLAFNSERNGQYDIFVTRIGPDGQSGEVMPFPGANTSDFEHLPAWGLPPDVTATPIIPSPSATRTSSPTATQLPPTHTPTSTLAPTPSLTPSPTQTPVVFTGIGSLDTCLGPIVFPCRWMGLPWWVCLLLLLPLIALLWLLRCWLADEVALSQRTVPNLERLTPFSGSSLPDVAITSPPPLLPARPAQPPRSSGKALVLGIGTAGLSALNVISATLRESYDGIPSQVRMLGIVDREPDVKPDEIVILVAPVDEPVEQRAAEIARAPEDFPAWSAWLAGDSDTRNRARQRLALWVHLQETRRRLRGELERLSLAEAAQRAMSLFVIVAPGEAEAAWLPDIVHLLRLEAERLKVQLIVYGCLILPDTFQKSHTSEQMTVAEQNSFAAWRELDRFQLAFDYPYPFPHPDEQTVRRGKLFERVYWFSPNRPQAALAGEMPERGIYPSIADAILGWLDPQARLEWDAVAHNTDNLSNNTQRRLNEPLYNSLGAFACVLPVERMVERGALRFAKAILEAQSTPPANSMREEALQCLEQESLTSGVKITSLIREIAGRARGDPKLPPIADLGALVADFIASDRSRADSQQAIKNIRTLIENYLPRAVRTSDGRRGRDYDGCYGPDIRRVIREAEAVDQEQAALERWMKAEIEIHLKIFNRLVCGQFQTPQIFSRLVNASIPEVLHQSEVMSAGRVAAFVEAMRVIIAEQRAIVAQCAKEWTQKAADQTVNVERHKKDLESNQETAERLPSLLAAILQGILPAITSEVLMGILAGFFAAVGLWIWLMLGLICGVLGGWWSWRKAHPRQIIPGLEKTFLNERQTYLEARIKADLYNTWEQTLAAFDDELVRILVPFRNWVTISEKLLESFSEKETRLEMAAREAGQIRTRRYLESKDLLASLYQRYLDARRAQEAGKRLYWHRDLTGDWALTILTTHEYPITLTCDAAATEAPPETLTTAETAMLDLCRWYAEPLRDVKIAEVMTNWIAEPDAIHACEGGSTPLIGSIPHEQTERQIHRFLFARLAGQESDRVAYFDQILAALKKAEVWERTQKRVELADPYRVIALATLDLLRRSGISQWSALRAAYLNTPSRRRACLHTFPAERNAVQIEIASSQIGVALPLLSSAACLILEDPLRARLFWLAYGLGYVRVMEEAAPGLASVRYYVMEFPTEGRLWKLTEPRDESPSLWEAAIAFVLGGAGGSTPVIQSALALPPGTPTRQRERCLEDALDSKMKPLLDSEKTLELGRMLQVCLEDELRRLEGGDGIW